MREPIAQHRHHRQLRSLGVAASAVVALCVSLSISLLPGESLSQEGGAVDTPVTRVDALEALGADDWRVRVAALEALGRGLPIEDDDVAKIAPLLEGPHLAVSAAAAGALARIATEDAHAALDDALGAPDAARREALAVAWLRNAPAELDETLASRAEGQIVSPAGRQWIGGRSTWLETVEIRATHAAELERIVQISERTDLEPTCFEQQTVHLGLQLDDFGERLDRADDFWRAGRLDRLEDEVVRLEAAVAVVSELEAAAQTCVTTTQTDAASPSGPHVSPPAVTPPSPAPTPMPNPFDRFFNGASQTDMFLFALSGHVGHDNHTFLLTPSLRVTEPGPFEGQAIDLRRDDTYSSGHLSIVYQQTNGGTIIDDIGEIGMREHPNQLWLAITGGYDGRLRWGQLSGPEGELDVVWDDLWREDVAEAQRLRVETRGGLYVPDWGDEENLLDSPMRRGGGTLSASWASYGAPPRSSGVGGAQRLRVAYSGEAWVSAEETDDAQGLVPPETWFTRHALASRWLFTDLDAAWLGLTGDAEVRFSEGDFAHGASAASTLRLEATGLEHSDLWFEAGYSVAVPFGETSPTTTLGSRRTAIDREVAHTPVLAGHYSLVEVDDEELRAEIAIDAEHRIALGGRYGWAAEVDRLMTRLRVDGPFGQHYGELSLYAKRARYPQTPLGAGFTEGIEGDPDIELVVAGLGLDVPLFPDDWFTLVLRGRGRLVSNSVRFDGRFEGQFRVQLDARLTWDMFDDDFGDRIFDFHY